MSIDLGDNPQGTQPDPAQQAQIKTALGIGGAWISQQLESEYGTGWKVGLPAIFGQQYLPNEELLPIYDLPLQVVIYNPYDEATEYFTLQYAGEFNGRPHYTYDGTPMSFDPYNVPSYTPEYSAVFWDSTNSYYRAGLYTQFEQEHVFAYLADVDFGVASLDPLSWVPFNATSFTMEAISLTLTELDPIMNGRMYRSGQGNNVFFANYVNGNWEWVQVVGFDGEAGSPIINLMNAEEGTLQTSVIGGVIGYDKGGTNAFNQQKAVQNLSAWVTSVTTNSNLNANNSGTTIVVNSASNVTLTIALNLPANTTFKVINRGTGQVNIAGATGVTLLGNFVSGTPNKSGISVKFDVATITQVASNTYVLSDNFKAAAF